MTVSVDVLFESHKIKWGEKNQKLEKKSTENKVEKKLEKKM